MTVKPEFGDSSPPGSKWGRGEQASEERLGIVLHGSQL